MHVEQQTMWCRYGSLLWRTLHSLGWRTLLIVEGPTLNRALMGRKRIVR